MNSKELMYFEMYSTASAGGSVSAAEKIAAEVKAKIMAKKGAAEASDAASGPATATPKSVVPQFTDTNAPPAHKVLLSSLVPPW